ncbi:MAG: PQQ-binding-like beta-propeller repeat protein [Candidatus Dormibacteria bacterium]
MIGVGFVAPRVVHAALSCTSGCVSWSAAYDGPGGGEDAGTAMGRSPDGRTLFVTGPSLGGTSFDYVTIAYDATTGAQRWVARYDAGGDDEPTALGVSPDGTKVFVSGESVGSGGAHDWATVAYDAMSGTQVWVQRVSNAFRQDNVASALGVSRDGARVYVTGWVTSSIAGNGLPNYDIGIVAYDTATGGSVWQQTFAGTAPASGTSTAWDIPYALAVAANGTTDRVVVAGRSDTASGATDMVVLSYDGLTGATQWQYLYSGPAHNRDIGYAVSASPDGDSVFATGYDTASDGSTLDYVTVGLDAGIGRPQWSQLYDAQNQAPPASTTGVTVNSLAFATAVSPDGTRVAITGTSGDWPGLYERSMTTIVYDTATGVSDWIARQPEPPDGGTGTGVVFSPDGGSLYVVGAEGNDVFAAGVGPAGGQYDDSLALAASYDVATGNQNWITSVGTTRQNGAAALALSPDGTELYLTGGAQDTQSDVATEALTTGVTPATGVPDLPSPLLVLLPAAAAAVAVRRRGAQRG